MKGDEGVGKGDGGLWKGDQGVGKEISQGGVVAMRANNGVILFGTSHFLDMPVSL